MSIKFTAERMEKIKESYSLWWQGKLQRPLMKISVSDFYAPDVPKPAAPVLTQENCHDFSYSPQELIDAFDYELSKKEFLADGFPYISFDMFGPGVASAFCGAKLDNSSGRVWFFPPKENQEIEDIHIKYDPENKWVKRIKSIYEAGIKKWNGSVIMGLPDFGGIMDVVAIFRESENLLYDLYDYPEEVTRLRKEAEIAWDEAYKDLSYALQCDKYGYTDWLGLYSATPAYVIQCDFSYMIGNDMFKEFVLPSLVHHTETLDHTIYHLDGVGELNHLDDILKIDKLNAIQWVYGDGKPKASHWIDSVYTEIEKANKGIHIIGGLDEFLLVYEKIKNQVFFNYELNNEYLPEFLNKTKNILNL